MTKRERIANHRAAVRRWRERHPEQAREALYSWRQRNPERFKAHLKKYRETHRAEAVARTREWQKAHPDKVREYSRRYQKTKRRAVETGSLTKAQWDVILRAFSHRCAYCGRKRKLGQDHVLPMSRGGAHAKSNVVPCCRNCNASKQDKTVSEWRSL